MMRTETELTQIQTHGLTPEKVDQQLNYFINGFPFLNISRAAVIGDGIVQLDSEATCALQTAYRNRKNDRRIVKFVPASGAATRMFKALFEYIDNGVVTPSVKEVIENLDRFAFASQLRALLGAETNPQNIIRQIILPSALGYGSAPKALIPFHSYEQGGRTALEEHLSEGALYAATEEGKVGIHFTVSPEHQAGFENLVKDVLPSYEAMYGVRYEVTYSQQKSSTDTIAVNLDNSPFREADGSLLFRPAGHGALLENLQDIDADLIFIKTVDNVAPDSRKKDTILYKEVIGGLMLVLQGRCFAYLRALEVGPVSEALLHEMACFFEEALCGKLPTGFANKPASEQATILQGLFNRPIRVCGMVKNEGEPGGGPFWVSEADGSESLQIAESSQIDPQQASLMAEATHFNPVDLVCGTKDYRGNKFNLSAFVDSNTGFISTKSKNGLPLKAQELPGLWNGAMARWNTIFVEVPITTFSPVKVIEDLLRPQHQAATQE